MSLFLVILTAVFIPLFPTSIIFNFLLWKIKNPALKIALLIGWPLLGIWLFQIFDFQPPYWVISLAAFTAILYAYRLLTERNVNTWAGFLATSMWSLFWLPLMLSDLNTLELTTFVLGVSFPIAIILLLANELQKRFEVVYTHLYGGLATIMPRFSVILIIVVLASIATPIFPSFFIVLKFLILSTTIDSPIVSIVLLLTWLIWSWSGIRIIQGLVVGSEDQRYTVSDLSSGLTWSLVIALVLLASAGLLITGSLL